MLKRSKPQHKPQPQPQDNDKVLIELWKAENDARKMEGLPPIPYEIWLEWYRWRERQAKESGGL